MSLVREKAAEARSSLGQDENALALSFVMKGAVGKSVLKNRTISKIRNPKYGPCTFPPISLQVEEVLHSRNCV